MVRATWLRRNSVHTLRRGAMTPDLLASELQADVERVKRTARRYKGQFIVLQGGNLGLLETLR